MSKGRKIIHVHFLSTRKNYYFSSIRALFKCFTKDDLKVTESYLSHILTEDGNHYLNPEVLIIRSRLLT